MSVVAGRIRVGLIGAGRHSNAIIQPALRLAPIDVVATCSRHDTPTYPGVRHYIDHERMLDAEAGNLDACIVAVPVTAYRRVLTDILARGLPVWSEKPAAENAADAAFLEDASRKAAKPLVVGFNKRFATAYGMAAAAMRRPEFGQPTSFFGKFMVGCSYYTDEASYLVDNPIHLIDLAHFFMGEVRAMHVERADIREGQWSYAVTLRFASGAVGGLQFGNTQSWQQHNEFVEITGEGHSVMVDNLVCYRYRPEAGPEEFWEPNFTVPADRNNSLVLVGYVGQFSHFVDVVLKGVTPRANISDARRALELCDDIRRLRYR
jgi:myo-inositol 2-dehydrogenase/D-chiro-inositol 1-dehydrogenase